MPIQTLFDYLTAGDGLDDFLDGFPGVSREMAITVIAAAGVALAERHGPRPS